MINTHLRLAIYFPPNPSLCTLLHYKELFISCAKKSQKKGLHEDGYYLDEHSKAIFGHLLKFILDIDKSGKEGKLLRPLPSMALICTVYGPLKMFAKMMEEGELLYSLELEEELADSFWNAIRWLDCSPGR
uniref:hypothetical protein n=2 Tax=unclassified Paenibacillus TaxID=185978 RepID=UPI00403F50F3